VETIEAMEEAVATFVARAAVKLRRDGLACGVMSIFLETNPFKTADRQYSNSSLVRFPAETNDTPEMIDFAHRALGKIFRKGYRYKKAGVMLMDLVRKDSTQRGLFDAVDRQRSSVVMGLVDKINNTFGRDTVKFGAQGIGNRQWSTKFERLSPHYTTRWDELPLATT
jgi:DNA polymerase V